MSSSPRLTVVAPAAGLCVLALGAGFFFMSGGQESSQASTGLTAQQLVQRAAAKNKTVNTKPKAAKPAAPKPAVKPKPKPKVDPTLNTGLPSTLTAAFSGRKVVVVALFAPDVPLDEMAVAEARAGASAAGVGFVALNVLHEAQARPLTKLLGVLEDPRCWSSGGRASCSCASPATPTSRRLRRPRGTQRFERDPGRGAPVSGGARAVDDGFSRTAKKEGRQVATLRRLALGSQFIIETDVYPVGTMRVEPCAPARTSSRLAKRRTPSSTRRLSRSSISAAKLAERLRRSASGKVSRLFPTGYCRSGVRERTRAKPASAAPGLSRTMESPLAAVELDAPK